VVAQAFNYDLHDAATLAWRPTYTWRFRSRSRRTLCTRTCACHDPVCRAQVAWATSALRIGYTAGAQHWAGRNV